VRLLQVVGDAFTFARVGIDDFCNSCVGLVSML
jgi:hypothetical protein